MSVSTDGRKNQRKSALASYNMSPSVLIPSCPSSKIIQALVTTNLKEDY